MLTIRRGEIIARDRKVLARPGSGRYLEGVPQEVRPQVRRGQSPGLVLQARAR